MTDLAYMLNTMWQFKLAGSNYLLRITLLNISRYNLQKYGFKFLFDSQISKAFYVF